MHGRFWFYLPVVIIITGLFSYLAWNNSKIKSEISLIEKQSQENRLNLINLWLDGQTDGRKLITLAKTFQLNQPELVEPVILKAYELLPNSRDAAILASYYQPELKEEVKKLDPLYGD